MGAFPFLRPSAGEKTKKTRTSSYLTSFSLPPFFPHHLKKQASRPAPKRASVAVRASDNEVDVDAIVKDIQQKVRGRRRKSFRDLEVFPFFFFFEFFPLVSLLLAHAFPPPFNLQWDAVEDKPSALLYAGGAVVLLWLASTVVGAVNAVPLLPKLLELVGLGYTSWFVYRYLLFKSSREELLADIEELKKKITS